ncbi:MAG: peptidoglycan glycosyltransferase [Clostridiales bacterium]|nr:peptidoglycan glycosyltransferase [Clostridiales bacterium]
MAKNKNKSKIKRKLSRKMQTKLALLFIIIALALFALNIRLTYINMQSGDKYTVQVLSQQKYASKTLPYQRGNILDRNGIVLATSVKVYNLILDPNIMLSEEGKYKETTISALVGAFGIDSNELIKIIEENSSSRYIPYTKGLAYEEIEEFVGLKNGTLKIQPEWFSKDYSYANIQGVWFEEEYRRSYPYSSLASHVLGFTYTGNDGGGGIEENYNNVLNGVNGREFGYLNSDSALERVIKSPTDGNNVVSTIDINLQMIIEKHIKEFNETTGSKKTAVILMNPNNGEILAEANYPFYDLNNPRDLTPFYTEEEISSMNDEETLNNLFAIWRNFAISDTFEPGSTSKVFTVAAGLEEGTLNKNDTFICDGHRVIGGWRIYCHKKEGHGLLTVGETLMYSCNVAMMDMAEKMGKDIFTDYQRIFGIGEATGIDLPGEASGDGLYFTANNMGPTDLATNSFGQNFNITMTQMIAAFSSVINGGYYYEPHIVNKIVEATGGTVKQVDETLIRQTVSRDTSETIKEYLYQTVEAGTAKLAQVPGYKIGGKTGTAEKNPRDGKSYLVSFIGWAPVDNPEVVIYVVIDEPNVAKQANSSYATTLSSKIMSEVLPYLNIFPTEVIVEEPTTGESTETIEGETVEETESTNAEEPTGAKPDYEEVWDYPAVEENTGPAQ